MKYLVILFILVGCSDSKTKEVAYDAYAEARSCSSKVEYLEERVYELERKLGL